MLQYEVQRPGERLSFTDDLIGLFHSIIAVMTRSREDGKGNDFWTLAPNVLMKNLFEVFYISGEPFSPNNFSRFINRAPKERDEPWTNHGYFTELIQRAEQGAAKGTDADRRMFHEAMEYWTRSFPGDPDISRGGIVMTFEAMAKTMNGRGIYEMICTDTNLTPEMILSGKIVILDFPVKQGAYGNMMIQQTWKLLYQQAIERRVDKGLCDGQVSFLRRLHNKMVLAGTTITKDAAQSISDELHKTSAMRAQQRQGIADQIQKFDENLKQAAANARPRPSGNSSMDLFGN